VRSIFLTLALLTLPSFSHSESETKTAEWVFILTGHNATGELVAVDTEGPFTTRAECEAVGIVVTRTVYEKIGVFQPKEKSGLEWDRLTTSCKEIKRPFSLNTY
jgi:hypothetical protein